MKKKRYEQWLYLGTQYSQGENLSQPWREAIKTSISTSIFPVILYNIHLQCPHPTFSFNLVVDIPPLEHDSNTNSLVLLVDQFNQSPHMLLMQYL